MTNITELKPNPTDIAKAVSAFRRDIVLMCELQSYLAQMRKASYDAHIKEGFSPEQAILLCMKSTV